MVSFLCMASHEFIIITISWLSTIKVLFVPIIVRFVCKLIRDVELLECSKVLEWLRQRCDYFRQFSTEWLSAKTAQSSAVSSQFHSQTRWQLSWDLMCLFCPCVRGASASCSSTAGSSWPVGRSSTSVLGNLTVLFHSADSIWLN